MCGIVRKICVVNVVRLVKLKPSTLKLLTFWIHCKYNRSSWTFILLLCGIELYEICLLLETDMSSLCRGLTQRTLMVIPACCPSPSRRSPSLARGTFHHPPVCCLFPTLDIILHPQNDVFVGFPLSR